MKGALLKNDCSILFEIDGRVQEPCTTQPGKGSLSPLGVVIEVPSGKVKAIDGEEAFARLHQRSKARRSS
jgi:hypothetical protein